MLFEAAHFFDRLPFGMRQLDSASERQRQHQEVPLCEAQDLSISFVWPSGYGVGGSELFISHYTFAY